MNFDFMKDLKGLGLAYDSCKDAEELATTKRQLQGRAQNFWQDLYIWHLIHSRWKN